MPALTSRGMQANWSSELVACIGCGALLDPEPVQHRPDCTAHPSPLTCSHPECQAVRPAGARTPIWRYDPSRRTYRCPQHATESHPE